MSAHRNHVEAQMARSRRRRERAALTSDLDASVLAALKMRSERSRAIYGYADGPFGTEASDIARAMFGHYDIGNCLKIAASLKRLKKLGLVNYSSFDKRWSAARCASLTVLDDGKT